MLPVAQCMGGLEGARVAAAQSRSAAAGSSLVRPALRAAGVCRQGMRPNGQQGAAQGLMAMPFRKSRRVMG